ncbi:MAG: DUF3604 domain-containing protein, partial [bacterium]|nr:DUF3604 domain-containing protein [bacterium]
MRTFPALVPALIVILTCPAQADPNDDYLSPALRQQVERLKASAAHQPTDLDNFAARVPVVWEWLNAYSLTGGQFEPNATVIFRFFREWLDESPELRSRADLGPEVIRRNLENLDRIIYELTLKDEHPNGMPRLEFDQHGPFEVGSWQTIKQTATVRELPIETGGAIMLGVPFLTDPGRLQYDDPRADNYVSLGSSNPNVRWEKTTVRWSGMHGGFRAAVPNLAFQLASGRLESGDTVTIVYGDRSGGSRGWQMQSFQNDGCLRPLYFDLEGNGIFVGAQWPAFSVVGGAVNDVRATVPSVVRTGERFDLVLRSEDRQFNRATGSIPEYNISLDGDRVRSVPAGSPALKRIEGLRLSQPGVYRYEVSSADGGITSLSNPVLVDDSPGRRIYWGETHGHTGMAEGQGTVDTFYRYGRDDAQLDFLGLSEHDIWTDAREWKQMRRAVDHYSEPGKFIAFLAYEWTNQRGRGGHHNVLFRRPDGRRARTVLDAYDLSLLYQKLREKNRRDDVLVIPHAHQAGDWRRSDPDLEPLVEIQSMHGTFEWFGNYYLRQGHRVGLIAASDGHRSRPGYSG